MKSRLFRRLPSLLVALLPIATAQAAEPPGYRVTEIGPGITEVLCYGTAVFVEGAV